MTFVLYYILTVWYASIDGATSFTQRYYDYESCADTMAAVERQFDQEIKAKELHLSCEPSDVSDGNWTWVHET